MTLSNSDNRIYVSEQMCKAKLFNLGSAEIRASKYFQHFPARFTRDLDPLHWAPPGCAGGGLEALQGRTGDPRPLQEEPSQALYQPPASQVRIYSVNQFDFGAGQTLGPGQR